MNECKAKAFESPFGKQLLSLSCCFLYTTTTIRRVVILHIDLYRLMETKLFTHFPYVIDLCVLQSSCIFPQSKKKSFLRNATVRTRTYY